MKGNSMIQIDHELDQGYLKNMLEETKRRVDDMGYVERRGMTFSNDTNFEGNYLTIQTLRIVNIIPFYR
jgi:hypothetical protein